MVRNIDEILNRCDNSIRNVRESDTWWIDEVHAGGVDIEALEELFEIINNPWIEISKIPNEWMDGRPLIGRADDEENSYIGFSFEGDGYLFGQYECPSCGEYQ